MKYIVFEFCEHTLEKLIEHLFHVDPRTAEVMVFYTMLSIGAFTAFKIIQRLPYWHRRLANFVSAYWQHEKDKTVEHWRAQPIKGKLKWGGICMAAALILIFWISS